MTTRHNNSIFAALKPFYIFLRGPVYSERSWVKVDGLRGLNWTIQSDESGRSSIDGRSAKVEGPKGESWTVFSNERGRSWGRKLDGLVE